MREIVAMGGAMEALIPAPDAHFGMIASLQPMKTVVRSSEPPGLRLSESTVALDFCGGFRKQRRQMFLRSHVRVGRRGYESQRSAVDVSAIDAAQPFDDGSKRSLELQSGSKLRVGIVGFGNYGQFLAIRILKQGHKVLAYSRGDYSEKARKLGVAFFRDADDFCEEHPEVVLLCTSILSTEAVLLSLPLQRLESSTLFVDVLSVKEFPKNLFLQVLPPEFDVLCTHPMFGPKSGKGSWAGLPFVYDKVRISKGWRSRAADMFLDIFVSEGCRMVEMSCAEHDRFAAGSQFITHTVGRVLGKLGLESTPINTKGYETLLGLVQNTSGDSFELYCGLFMYNPNAIEELERLEAAFDSIKRQLFGQLHDVLRKLLFGEVDIAKRNLLQRPAESLQNGSSHPGASSNGGSRIVCNTDIVPPIFESVVGKSIELDKEPEAVRLSSNPERSRDVTQKLRHMSGFLNFLRNFSSALLFPFSYNIVCPQNNWWALWPLMPKYMATSIWPPDLQQSYWGINPPT
ncbi:arogenate dehydrogenase 2, chloroplastic isoform X1 [Physcomitrium patens]|uniref:Prephenate/arogenate dehydrogenase domain-containing protein n=1 Tax=Physcomitrium patens TaxID=3218 RepID=A0A7I4DKT7_PHYPA|nr:arogenate dehydrogenase 2, chloroplastic-like isoform X3 [Physcomitrium patens]|eukprot:XP_024372844.1 arogenate dehydrogenase 2, chloroplastic-like isoform X3 [Physcomitrella patens]